MFFMLSAFAIYIMAAVMTAYSFKRREIAVAVAVLLCFNLIALAILGFTLFKETLGLKEIIGITLTLFAIVIFNV